MHRTFGRAGTITALAMLLANASPGQNNGKGQSQLEKELSKALGGQPARQVPAGFTVSARSGNTGQALTATFNAPPSAKRAFSGAYKQLASYFDQAPALQSAFGDPKDQQIQAFFRAVYQGAPVTGLMAVGVQYGTGHAAVLFDREDLFRDSLPGLTRQMTASLPKPAAGAAAPQGPPQLTQTPLPDGSGSIGLAPGWKVIDSYKGSLDANGPNGEFMSLGIFQQVLTQPIGAETMFGPYRQPWPAFVHFADVHNKNALSRRQASIRLIEQTPDQYQGGQAAWLAYEFVMDGKNTHGLVWVATAPLADGSWFYYMSLAGAPAAVYARQLPTMVAMWKSWGVNQAVYRERMDAALKSMRETFQIMQSIHDNQMKVYNNANAAWDETIRGVTTIQNTVTGQRTQVSTNNAQGIVNQLNQQGFNVQVVPTNQLVQ